PVTPASSFSPLSLHDALPIFCDATVGDHFCGKFGDLQSTPLRLAIRAGRLVDAACERKDLQQEFWEYCHTDENSDRVGELAFGTDRKSTRLNSSHVSISYAVF